MTWSNRGGERSAARKWVREGVGGKMRLMALGDCLALRFIGLYLFFSWVVLVCTSIGCHVRLSCVVLVCVLPLCACIDCNVRVSCIGPDLCFVWYGSAPSCFALTEIRVLPRTALYWRVNCMALCLCVYCMARQREHRGLNDFGFFACEESSGSQLGREVT